MTSWIPETEEEYNGFFNEVRRRIPKERLFEWDPRRHTMEELCDFLNVHPCPKKGKTPRAINTWIFELDFPVASMSVNALRFFMHWVTDKLLKDADGTVEACTACLVEGGAVLTMGEGFPDKLKRFQDCKKALRKAHSKQKVETAAAKMAKYDANKVPAGLIFGSNVDAPPWHPDQGIRLLRAAYSLAKHISSLPSPSGSAPVARSPSAAMLLAFLKALIRSPFLETLPMLGKSLDPSTFRDRMMAAWTTIGVVGALFLTMLDYSQSAKCESDHLLSVMPSQEFCDTIHPFLCSMGLAFNVIAVILTTILIMQVGFVPDEKLSDWVAGMPITVELPLVSFIIGALMWAGDLVWLGVVAHGAYGVRFSVGAGIIAISLLGVYASTRAKTNRLIMLASGQQDLNLSDTDETGDPEQIRTALQEAKDAGADAVDSGEAAEDPSAMLELCQKAEAFKKKGNERLKDNTKSAAREALEFFTSGLEVRCSDPKLNAQLFSNRAHVRLLLRQFVEAVDDCRKAIDRDPKNIKAYWRAARASLHLDLCRNGIDFCEEGLRQAPGDSDLIKLRDSCAEKLAGQQQRRAEARSSANRDFNADEAMAVQEKVSGLNEQLARVQASFAQKQRQRVRLELTQQTVTSTPEDAKLYRGVGRCFLLGDRQPILDEMKTTMDSIDEELPKLQKASQELEKRKDDAEKELREMIAAFQKQADRSAAAAA
ncbi:ttc4 [Symbiodinium pilosum]|uniref:Ttc4 protein n=1 Tax=Symbiodinium pilosum TaxID=2952 RepID=A0A812PLJ9_SYMPI|nr:ttc4 [Symbiodinium pilosum]